MDGYPSVRRLLYYRAPFEQNFGTSSQILCDLPKDANEFAPNRASILGTVRFELSASRTKNALAALGAFLSPTPHAPPMRRYGTWRDTTLSRIRHVRRHSFQRMPLSMDTRRLLGAVGCFQRNATEWEGGAKITELDEAV